MARRKLFQPSLREILRHLPGEMVKTVTSPVRFFGRFIRRQLRKELQFRERMQSPSPKVKEWWEKIKK